MKVHILLIFLLSTNRCIPASAQSASGLDREPQRLYLRISLATDNTALATEQRVDQISSNDDDFIEVRGHRDIANAEQGRKIEASPSSSIVIEQPQHLRSRRKTTATHPSPPHHLVHEGKNHPVNSPPSRLRRVKASSVPNDTLSKHLLVIDGQAAPEVSERQLERAEGPVPLSLHNSSIIAHQVAGFMHQYDQTVKSTGFDYSKIEAGLEAARNDPSESFDTTGDSCGARTNINAYHLQSCNQSRVLQGITNESTNRHIVMKIGGEIKLLAPGSKTERFLSRGDACFQIQLWDGPTGEAIASYWTYPNYLPMAEGVSILPLSRNWNTLCLMETLPPLETAYR